MKEEKFIKRVRDIYGDKILLTSEYKGVKNKVKFICNKCNTVGEVRADKLLEGRSCKVCSGYKYTLEFLRKRVEALDNDYRIIADEFINVDKKVKFKHLGCGFEYETTPSLFFEGCRCPKCFGNNSKTTEEYKEVVRELSDGEYVVLGEYKNSQTNVDILHKKCGNILTTISPNGFIHAGIRCRFCGNKSKGEEEIKRVLDKYNILYEREKTFSGLKYKRNLYYDFYIESLNTCIEFNGMQHYKPSTTFGGEKQFERQIVRDAIKNAYCEDHNIGLIIIPFWDIRNVENILKQKFNLKECI